MGISGFRAAGIYPLNMAAIPEYAYLLSCDLASNPSTQFPPSSDETISPQSPTNVTSPTNMSSQCSETNSPNPNFPTNSTTADNVALSLSPESNSPQPGCSTVLIPTKAIKKVWPILSSLKPSNSKRKQNAANITEPAYIEELKRKQSLQKQKGVKRAKSSENEAGPAGKGRKEVNKKSVSKAPFCFKSEKNCIPEKSGIFSIRKPFENATLKKIPKELRTLICGIVGHKDPNNENLPARGRPEQCAFCPRNKDRKGQTLCVICSCSLCTEHRHGICIECKENTV
ncbi:hypothetical protein C0J52_24157 [Blattella germanica]|nr:hypothetical protein C0J52_24157 [Blattella germanica]